MGKGVVDETGARTELGIRSVIELLKGQLN